MLWRWKNMEAGVWSTCPSACFFSSFSFDAVLLVLEFRVVLRFTKSA